MRFTVDAMTLYFYSIPIRTPFRISAGVISHKNALLVEMRTRDGVTGWGEASVDAVPYYAHETVGTVTDILKNTLFPLLKGREFAHPDEVTDCMDGYRGNHFAKAAVDAAAWDIWGKMAGEPVWKLLGGTRDRIESGPTVGIKDSPEAALAEVDEYMARGDARIKLKVAPGFDTKYIEKIRAKYPDIRLMVDANSAYTIDDAEHLRSWRRFKLLMMEQPLAETDIYFHSKLRPGLGTPLCLDESMHYLHDVRCCGEMGAADIINIKVCRVGGLTQSRRVHDLCQKYGIANWIGGRFGFSVAVAPRIAAATLPNCTLPTDCVLDLDYMVDDIVEEPFTAPDYWTNAPTAPGLGFTVDRAKLKKYTVGTMVL